MPRNGARLAALRIALPVIGAMLVLAACGGRATDKSPPGFFPSNPATTQGRDINDLYSFVFWVSVVIFFLVEGLILWAVLRYRRRDDSLPPQTHGHLVLELVWTVIPAALVVLLFVMTLQTLGRVEAHSPDRRLTVDVTGFQWQWTFAYKEQGLSFTGLGDKGPEMVVPVGETVHLKLHASDVIHAFYVPEFLHKKDVVPGRENAIDLRIEEPGVYEGQCYEFCGLNHATMFFTVRAVPRAEFDAWVAAEQAKARATPTPAPSGAQPGGGQDAATLQVAAENSQAFTVSQLVAPAGQPLTIQFQNRDPGAPHNVAIRNATPQGDFVGQPIAQPGQSATYNTPALSAGQYEFFCSVHPNMKGDLTVQ